MGRVLTNNTGLSYAIEVALGSLAQAIAAQQTLTFSGNAVAAEAVTIGAQTYNWIGTLASADDVLVGGDTNASVDNLVAAINASAAGSGSQYDAGTAENVDVTAVRGPGDTIIVTAKTPGTAANSIATTETMTNGVWGAATLLGGLDSGDANAFNDEWKQTEPNDITGFGATITKVPRAPISNRRQRRKGSTTDLDSVVEFESDTTFDSFEDFVEGFVFSLAVNADIVFRGALVANGAYHIDSPFTAAQDGKLINAAGAITLVQAAGYLTAANNGLKPISSAPGLRGSSIAAAALVNETAPANAVLKLAGVRTDDLTWDYSAGPKTAALVSAADIADWAALGLTAGQVIHIGSPDGSGGVTNAFTNNDANDMFGYARILSIAGATMTMDKIDPALQFDDLTVQPVDVMFGRFFRNVPVDDAEFIERSFQFEAAWSNLQDPGPGDEYEYAKGNFCNLLEFNLPLTDKSTATFGFIGTDTDLPTPTRKLGAATARQPQGTVAFNTTSDIARLRITEVDEDGLTTDFKSLTLSLNNNVSPEKVLGTLGAKFLNTGNFEVDVAAQVLFTSSKVTRAIRNNETVKMDFIIKNDDGAIAVDIPSMTLGGGDKELPVNESVLLNTTGEAFEDPILGTSIGISELPSVP